MYNNLFLINGRIKAGNWAGPGPRAKLFRTVWPARGGLTPVSWAIF